MADQNTDLPEGTDRIIDPAGEPVPEPALSSTGAIGVGASDPGLSAEDGEVLTVTAVDSPRDDDVTGATGPVTSGSANTGVIGKIRSGGEKLSGQAATRARGLVGQGLERSAETLANVGRLVGDTAEGLEERLGAEYGDYARRAAGAIENAASNLASKDPDELIDDTRNLVRRSPGVALAGAAIVGFALARLIKSGLATSDEDRDGETSRRSES